MSVDGRCAPACPRTNVAGISPDCPPPSQHYKGTLDVMRRVAHEVIAFFFVYFFLFGITSNQYEFLVVMKKIPSNSATDIDTLR